MQPDQNPLSGLSVHKVLAEGYLLYLIAIVAGFVLSYFFPDSVSFPLEADWGWLFILLGSALAYWAQRATGKTATSRDISNTTVCKENFCVGPYRYTRSPTQYALLLMAFGLSLVYGSLYMAIGSCLAFLIGKFVIIPKEEKHLEERYGEPYREYKHDVKI